MGKDKVEKEPWVMPEWMEEYRPYIDSLAGGNPIEELMNDTVASLFNNSIRVIIISQIRAMVSILCKLKNEGKLK